MDLTEPFRGSDAVRAGLLSPKTLRGPRFRRLFPDVYVSAEADVDLALRSRAAFVLADGRGVLGGYSAAELLGASCGPAGAPAEVVVPYRMRPRADLRVRQDVLALDEIVIHEGIAVTSPVRTAYDLARRPPLVAAVIAVDALGNVWRFDPQEVIRMSYRHLGARGNAWLPRVVGLANPLADSPMETRIRLAIHFAGLPPPVLQFPVGPYFLDLAYPDVLLGVEHDGHHHLDPQRARRDLERQAWLSSRGWKILRFSAEEVVRRPFRLAERVRAELRAR